MIVPGGGLSPDGQRWIACRKDFFLPVIPLARLFRGKLLDAVQRAACREKAIFPRRLEPQAASSSYQSWLDGLYSTSWNVYAKPPFGGAEGGLDYLARYTHRVAIANHRLTRLEDDRVFFRYKDYRDNSRVKPTSLEAVELIRRFLMHVLPPGLRRIRFYGLLANRYRTANLERCRALLGADIPSVGDGAVNEDGDEILDDEIQRLTGLDPRRCPVCGEGELHLLSEVHATAEVSRHARAPP